MSMETDRWNAEIRRERGVYAVYVRGKHYASCDSLHEAQEEIEGMKSARKRAEARGRTIKKAVYSIQHLEGEIKHEN